VGGNAAAYDLALQPDGKILLVGSVLKATTGNDLCVVRYHASGSLDAGFSGDGKVTAIGTTGNDFGPDVQVQPTGRIVAAGCSHNPVADFNAARVFRFHMDGTRDTGFGTGGGVFTVIGSGGTAFDSIALQPDGKIVAAGHSIETTIDFAVARYHGHLRDHIFEDGFDADVSTAVEPGT